MSASKQRGDESLYEQQRIRLSNIQSDLNRVGSCVAARSFLSQRSPWDNASRGDLPYRPCERLQQMIRDVAKSVSKKGSQAEQEKFRACVIVFYQTLIEDALEPLMAAAPGTDVLELFQHAEKEQTEAVCAAAVDLQAPNPTNDATAAREFEEAAIANKRVAESLRGRARGFLARGVAAHMRVLS